MAASVAELCAAAIVDGAALEPLLTVSEWADRYRILSSVASAEPGPWKTERTPYLREIMDLLSPSCPIERIVVMAGAQTGKTECGNNWIGYIIHLNPGPILMVLPTVETAKRVSKQRIAPMIDSTPVLRARVAEARARDSGNTVQVKEFAGGVLIITGANSSAGLRSMPIRFLFMDEIDNYPGDVDGQGDPVSLAEKRTSTFARRKIFLPSTPTIKGVSRIEAEFLASDQRRYFIPCPSCGHMDYLTWRDPAHHRIEWDEGRPETAHMVCSACGAAAEEWRKTQMLLHGQWRATAAGDGRSAGFHLPALYSPVGWKSSWAACAAEFLRAKENPFLLKAWVNTVLAETWEEAGDSVEVGSLKSRLEQYAAEVPHGVGVLVAAVDVHPMRLEAQVVGFGDREESWLIAFEQLMGDASSADVWFKLDQFLQQPFAHESKRVIHVERAVVDTGGDNTEDAYKYCAARTASGVYAIKGGSLTGLPLVQRPSMRNRYGIPLHILCVDTGKALVMGRMQIRTPGPGYMHLSQDIVDDEYLEQLSAERAIRKYVKGRGSVRVWEKIRARNEALDLTVYSLAALYTTGEAFVKNLGRRAAEWSRPPSDEAPKPAPQAPRRRNWVQNW